MSPRPAARTASSRHASRVAPAVSPGPAVSLLPRTRADFADLTLLLAVVLAWWGGTVGLALHQDDFLLVQGPHGPWRALFVSLLGTLWRLAHATAWPYHAAVLALHGGVAWLVCRLARALGASRLAALTASAAFAVSSTHAYSLYNIASAADVAASACALLATAAALRRRDGLAALAFLAALACKETVAALPLALLFLPGGARRRLPWGLLVMSAAWLVLLRVNGQWVTQQFAHLYIGSSPGDMLQQFLGYVSATVDWYGTRVDAYRNVADPSPWYLLAAAVAWVASLALSRLRGIALFAAAWFLCAIAPVTTTRSMFVLYYLYIPMAGVALWAACAFTRLRAPAALVVLVGAGLAAGSASVLARLESALLPETGVHAQSSLRHAQIAGAALADLEGVPLGEAAAVWMPRRYPASAWRNHGWYGQNVRSALSDGRAMMLVCPGLRTVAFATVDDEYPGRTVVAMGWDGHVRAVTPAAR